MSKRAERKARRAEKIKGEVRTAAIIALAGVVFLALGCVGIAQNASQYRACQDPANLRTVTAVATYVEIRSVRGEYDYLETVWDAQLQYTVDGAEFQDKLRLDEPMEKGEEMEIEVCRVGGGYRVPRIRTRDDLFAASLIPAIGSAVGLGLAVIGGVVAADGRKKLREGKR